MRYPAWEYNKYLCIDGPKRGEHLPMGDEVGRLSVPVNFGMRGYRAAIYDRIFTKELGTVLTFRGWDDDPTWKEKFPAPGYLKLPARHGVVETSARIIPPALKEKKS